MFRAFHEDQLANKKDRLKIFGLAYNFALIRLDSGTISR